MKILIVDDDPTSQALLSAVLEKGGFVNIQVVSSGEEAVDLIEKDPPDVILLDIFMPGLNGYDVCARVRSNELTAHIPVLLVTGGPVDADESIERGFVAGATDFLTKPIRSIELLSRVKASLTIKRKHDRLLEELERRRKAEKEKEKIIDELRQALAQVKTMSGLLPICSYCKQVRDDKGYWNRIEKFISEHSGVDFSHSICPECMEKNHPEMNTDD